MNKKTVYIRRTEVALKQEESKAGASDIRSCEETEAIRNKKLSTPHKDQTH